MKNKSSLCTLVLTCLVTAPLANANTLAFWNTNDKAMVVSRTMDINGNDMPKLRTSPPGLTRIGDLSINHLSWVSKYGSLVVTAFNSNAATDGMNDQDFSSYVDHGKHELWRSQ